MTAPVARYPDRSAQRRLIIAVDGEGKNLAFPDGQSSPDELIAARGWHSYTLLAAADDQGKRKVLSRPLSQRTEGTDTYARNLGLSTRDCLDFLLSLPSDDIALKVGFYFSYDVVKIVADLPVSNLAELGSSARPDNYRARVADVARRFPYLKPAYIEQADMIAAETTIWEGYLIKYVPRKKLTIIDLNAGRTWDKNARRYVWNRKCTVWDVFGFFQKSFVRALKDAPGICPTDVIERIEAMKDQRGEFASLPDDKIEAYCLDECYYLARLVRDMLSHIESLGLVLNGWDGSGALARAWMRRENIKDYKSETNLPYEVMLLAYFGGRFEVAELGSIGDGYSYDINSAYPAIATNLPCLAHGRFRHLAKDANGHVTYQPGQVGVYLAGSKTSGRFAPFPFRIDDASAVRSPDLIHPKSVYYAHGGQRWVWQDEAAVAIKHFGQDSIPLHDGWVWESECSHKPFGMVPDLYADRKKLKAAGDGAEKVIKLLINSIYGKTAQSIGWSLGRDGTPKPPPFQSFIWAGMITSGTRAMILDAIMQSDTVSIATDGIITRTPLDTVLTIGKDLGEWGADIVNDVYLFQSGVYTMLNPGEKCGKPDEHDELEDDPCQRIYKTRGFSAKEISAIDLITAWESHDPDKFTLDPDNEATRFVPIRSGILRTQPLDYIGQWVKSSHKVTIAHTRRIPDHAIDIDSGLPVETIGQTQGSSPYTFPDDAMSAAYVPKQTWEDVERELEEMSGDYLEWSPADDRHDSTGAQRERGTSAQIAYDPWQ